MLDNDRFKTVYASSIESLKEKLNHIELLFRVTHIYEDKITANEERFVALLDFGPLYVITDEDIVTSITNFREEGPNLSA